MKNKLITSVLVALIVVAGLGLFATWRGSQFSSSNLGLATHQEPTTTATVLSADIAPIDPQATRSPVEVDTPVAEDRGSHDAPVPSLRDVAGNSRTFKTVDELQQTSIVNPRGLHLTNDQRKVLQAMLDKAKREEDAVLQELREVTAAHAEHLIAQGLGRDHAVGEKVRPAKQGETLYTSRIGDGPVKSVSFDVKTDPATAPVWQKRQDLLLDYSRQIKEFFQAQQ